MKEYLILALEFFKTGLFAVGGGLATIPFLHEMVKKYGWFSEDTLATMIAVSESTPGPIGVNMATFTGFLAQGVMGGIVTTIFLVMPSVIVIFIVSRVLNKFKESKLVEGIFYGIRPAVVGFILSACMGIFKMTFFKGKPYLSLLSILSSINIINIGLFALIYLVYKKFKLHPILIIIIGAACGLVFKLT